MENDWQQALRFSNVVPLESGRTLLNLYISSTRPTCRRLEFVSRIAFLTHCSHINRIKLGNKMIALRNNSGRWGLAIPETFTFVSLSIKRSPIFCSKHVDVNLIQCTANWAFEECHHSFLATQLAFRRFENLDPTILYPYVRFRRLH